MITEERTNYNMKLIMENWRSFLTEDNIGSPNPVDLHFLDLLDKEEINEIPKALKRAALGLGLAAGGVGLGALGGAAIDSAANGEKTAQQVDAEDELTSKLIKRKGSPKQYMKQLIRIQSDSITDAPSSGNYKWIPPENIKNSDILPYMSMTVRDYREAQRAKDIKTLYKHLFGTSGMWGGSDMETLGGSQVLPPSWSITFDIYREKVQYKIEQVLKDLDTLGEEGAAQKFGMPYEELEKKLYRLQNTIRTK